MDKVYLNAAGVVDLVDALGEVVSVHLPAGVYSRRALQKSLRGSAGGHPAIEAQTHYDSAANPLFRVSPAAREARRLQRLLTSTSAAAARAERAVRHLERARGAVPDGAVAAAGHEPGPLVDDAGSVSAT